MPTPSILIVDDEEIVRYALRRELEASGYELHFADCSQAAFEILAHQRIDIIISDNVMPGGMAGGQFLRVGRHLPPPGVRLHGRWRSTPGCTSTPGFDGDAGGARDGTAPAAHGRDREGDAHAT